MLYTQKVRHLFGLNEIQKRDISLVCTRAKKKKKGEHRFGSRYSQKVRHRFNLNEIQKGDISFVCARVKKKKN